MFEGLYILKSEGLLKGQHSSSKCVSQSLMSFLVSCQNNDSAIMLWHY